MTNEFIRGIKELNTSMYSNELGITGCTKNTLIWWHEYRHSQQFKNKYMKNIIYLETLIIRGFGTFFIIYGFIIDTQNRSTWLLGAGLCLVPTAIITVMIEIDAWLFGTIYWLKHKNDKIR